MREELPRVGRHSRPQAPLTPKRIAAFLARPDHVGENERLARGLLALGQRAGAVPPRLVAYWKKRLFGEMGPYGAAASHLRTILSARSAATKPDAVADGLRAWALLTRLYHEWSRALARSRYNAVLKRQPKHPGALFNLGVLLVDHLRLPAEGKKIFARYLRLSPHKHSWENMQYARHKLGMPPYRPPPKRLRPY